MHPLFLIALVLVIAVVWVSGTLLALIRLSRVQRPDTDPAAPRRADEVVHVPGDGRSGLV